VAGHAAGCRARRSYGRGPGALCSPVLLYLGNAMCCQHARNLQQAANQSDHFRLPSGSIRKADRPVKPTLEPGAKLDSCACLQDNACVPQDAAALPACRRSKSSIFSLLAVVGSYIRPGDLHLQASLEPTPSTGAGERSAGGDADLTNNFGCLGAFEGAHASLPGTLQTDSRSPSMYGRCLESAARGPLQEALGGCLQLLVGSLPAHPGQRTSLRTTTKQAGTMSRFGVGQLTCKARSARRWTCNETDNTQVSTE
jgi:hypothetical protein